MTGTLYKQGKEQSKITKKFVFLCSSLILSALFILLFSYSTSPLYPNYYGADMGGDSAQFLTVGKAWAEGIVPYRDIFDHKGPVIFFVDMLGFLLFGNKSGVALFQILFLFLFCLSVYKTSSLYKKSFLYGTFSLLVVLIFLKVSYINGNTVEEYCLPFIGFSTYYQVAFLSEEMDGKCSHSPKRAFLYGATLAIGLLTRLTNVLPVCLGVMVITCVLLWKKNFQNLGQNILGFVSGFLVLFLPFYLYFVMYGAAKEFWFAVLFYNIEYSNEMASWLQTATAEDIRSFVQTFFPWLLCGASAVLAFFRKKILSALYLIWFVSEFYMFCSGSQFGQYSIIAVTQAALFLNEVMMLSERKPQNQVVQIAGIALVVVVCWQDVYQYVPVVADMYQQAKKPAEKEYQRLIEQIPEEDRDSFISYSLDNQMKDIYLVEDLLPCYKYFAIQEWHASFSAEVREDIHKTFAQASAKWILTSGPTDIIQDVLDSSYEIWDTSGQYNLYVLIS